MKPPARPRRIETRQPECEKTRNAKKNKNEKYTVPNVCSSVWSKQAVSCVIQTHLDTTGDAGDGDGAVGVFFGSFALRVIRDRCCRALVCGAIRINRNKPALSCHKDRLALMKLVLQRDTDIYVTGLASPQETIRLIRDYVVGSDSGATFAVDKMLVTRAVRSIGMDLAQQADSSFSLFCTPNCSTIHAGLIGRASNGQSFCPGNADQHRALSDSRRACGRSFARRLA